MSLVTLIRDYIDVATSSDQLESYTISSLAYYTLAFLFSVIRQVIIYCFTFQWLRDLAYFCLTPTKLLSSVGNVHGLENQPLSNLIAFSESNFLTGINLIFFGFFNGCFSCLHFSAANLVTIQRILVQGVPAGICSAFGTALGQCSFFACILFGFRGLLFPWLSLEPIPFLLGIGILLAIASTTAQDRRTPTIQWSSKSSLLLYTCTSAILAWCEQTAIFQLLGNISLGTEPTLLETTPSLINIHTVFGNIQQLIQNSTYLVAFFLGNFLGTYFLGYIFQRFLELLLRSKGIAIYYGLVKQANLPLATLIFAFGFGSLPYYGVDYLITKGFGFLPHENFFKQTLFSPVNLVSKTAQTKEPSQSRLEDQLALLFTLEGEKTKSFVVDTTPFDDGQYLKVGQKRPQAFEDLNYRGEHLWTNRLSRISNIREQANQTQSSFLGPIFSWMRAFLWGDGPTVNSIETSTSLSSSRRGNGGLASFPLAEDTEANRRFAASHARQSDSSFSSTTPSASHAQRDKEYGFEEKSLLEMRDSQIGDLQIVGAQQVPLRRNSDVRSNKIIGERKKELPPEREQIDNYVKEFDRQFDKGFSNFYNTEPNSLIEVDDQWQEKRIKEKCYTNPIYTFLLNTEIDSFLTRQPNYHWLSPEEEILLLKRRQLLSKYYDTLALTNQVSTNDERLFGQLVPKSYNNAIYNHQFKGTLKIARRLFSIKKVFTELNDPAVSSSSIQPNEMVPKTFRKMEDLLLFPPSGDDIEDVKSKSSIDPSYLLSGAKQDVAKGSTVKAFGSGGLTPTPGSQKLVEKTRMIKFDQPLFSNEKKGAQQIFFHEELNTNPKQFQQTGTPPLASPLPKAPKEVTREFSKEIALSSSSSNVIPQGGKKEFDASLQEGERGAEKMSKSVRNTQSKISNIFLLEQSESFPLYAGWDEQLRKLILTNRFQSPTTSGYTFFEFPKNKINSFPPYTPTGVKENANQTSISFTTWPLPNPFLENPLASQSQGSNTRQTSSFVNDLSLSQLFSDSENKPPTSSKASNSSGSTDVRVSVSGAKQVSQKGKEESISTNQSVNNSSQRLINNMDRVTPTGFAKLEKDNIFVNPIKFFKTFFGKIGSNPFLKKDTFDTSPASQGPTGYSETSEQKGGKNGEVVKRRSNSLEQRGRPPLLNFKNQFLFHRPSPKEAATNDMTNALLQWQKLIKENKQLSKEDKQAAKEKVSYWPKNVSRANWSNEFIDNEMEFDEPNENVLKKQIRLWEFIPPNHGGFVWPGRILKE